MKKTFGPALAGVLSLGFANVAAAQCEVVTDGSLDMLPQLDIVSASMFTDGSKIGATIEVFDFNLPTIDADYAVHWVDSTGNGYFIAAGVLLDQSQGLLSGAVADVGFYDPSTGIYDWNADAEGEAFIDGNTLTVVVEGRWVGNPSGTLTGIGARTTEYFTGLYPIAYDSTSDDGEWTVGDNCGGKDESAVSSEEMAANARGIQSAASGATGWLTLLLGGVLLGLRRRFR